MQKYRCKIEFNPSMIVDDFIRTVRKSWFEKQDNDFYQKEDECRSYLMVWAKTGESGYDHDLMHLVYLDHKFREYLESFELIN